MNGFPRLLLGGHEYLPDGRSRGFNEDLAQAVTPGTIFPGFGAAERKAVLRAAYDLGINAFDVTLDAEKEALGRNFAELPPPYEVWVQTRPEGMCYSYDDANRKMTDLNLLRAEVLRCLKLLRRERIELFNFGILRGALEQDAEFLPKLVENIAALQREGLILHAAADTFSGQAVYEAMIATGAFATINVNFNVADDSAQRCVFAAARSRGMRVVVREALIKGELFRLGGEAGIIDTALLARAALKWVLSNPRVDALIIGAGSPEHLRANVAAAATPGLEPHEAAVLQHLVTCASFAAFQANKRADFVG